MGTSKMKAKTAPAAREVTPQEKMEAAMKKLGIPFSEIRVFGSQIHVDCRSYSAAQQWRAALARFSKVRGVRQVKRMKKDQAKVERERRAGASTPRYYLVWALWASLV